MPRGGAEKEDREKNDIQAARGGSVYKRRKQRYTQT